MCLGECVSNLAVFFLKNNLYDLYHNLKIKKTLVVTKVGGHISFNISIK
jgi:hypothetical protein